MRITLCWVCGQLTADDRPDERHLLVECRGHHVCEPCREKLRAPQGEAVRLFTPAPTVMPGQLGFGDA